MTIHKPTDILDFWKEAGWEKWFRKDVAFDAEIKARFGSLLDAHDRGELREWESTPDGALALVILLDQFPRNMFRNDPRAFAHDAEALGITEAALARGDDFEVDADLRLFFYLPFEHDETIASQDRSVALFTALGDADTLKYAEVHRDVIARFGRFPHRNAVLGRETTAEEQAFLDEGGFAG
jgi:uncharacterized protein (DUF924 family)